MDDKGLEETLRVLDRRVSRNAMLPGSLPYHGHGKSIQSRRFDPHLVALCFFSKWNVLYLSSQNLSQKFFRKRSELLKVVLKSTVSSINQRTNNRGITHNMDPAQFYQSSNLTLDNLQIIELEINDA
jgi:hypothetical protein